jgi:MFS family permease
MTADAPRSWRGLAGVLVAQGLAWTGTRLSAIALPWFVLTSTGSAAQTGIVVFVEMTPYVIVQLLSGPLIDHVGPRRISIAGDLISTGAVAMIPLLYAIGALEMWSLLPLVAIVGASRGPSDAAKGVFIPAMTEAAGVPLERGTGLTGTIERLASTVGPGVAGILVAWVGGAYALTVTAVMFGLGAIVIGWATPRHEPSPDKDSAAGYLARLRGGAEFVRGEPLLRSIVAMVAITNLLDAAWISVLLPVWARETGHGPAVIGLVVAVMSAASIVSSVLAAAFAHRMPRRPTYLIGFLLGGAPRFVVLALNAPIWLVVAVYVVSGFGSGFINPIIGAIQFERAPREMYGRVRTLVVAVAWSGIPFGGLVGGGLVALLGLSPALLVAGSAYLITTTLPAFRKEWAEMDLRRRLGAARHVEPAVQHERRERDPSS